MNLKWGFIGVLVLVGFVFLFGVKVGYSMCEHSYLQASQKLRQKMQKIESDSQKIQGKDYAVPHCDH